MGCVLKGLAAVGLLVVVAILVPVFAGYSKRAEQVEAERSGSSGAPQAGSQSSEDAQIKSVEIGERFELGDFAYTVEDALLKTSVGRSFGREKAPDGAKFILVLYTIENVGEETETTLVDDFRIIDHGGRKFSPDSKVGKALVMSGKSELILRQLQPGIPTKGITGFMVPDTALEGPLSIEIPEKGLFGSDRVRVQLAAVPEEVLKGSE